MFRSLRKLFAEAEVVATERRSRRFSDITEPDYPPTNLKVVRPSSASLDDVVFFGKANDNKDGEKDEASKMKYPFRKKTRSRSATNAHEIDYSIQSLGRTVFGPLLSNTREWDRDFWRLFNPANLKRLEAEKKAVQNLCRQYRLRSENYHGTATRINEQVDPKKKKHVKFETESNICSLANIFARAEAVRIASMKTRTPFRDEPPDLDEEDSTETIKEL